MVETSDDVKTLLWFGNFWDSGIHAECRHTPVSTRRVGEVRGSDCDDSAMMLCHALASIVSDTSEAHVMTHGTPMYILIWGFSCQNDP